MDTNPYLTPMPADVVPTQAASIQYRTFGGRTFSFTLTQETNRDQVRREAQRAIDEEIGADKVVSIIEHTGSFAVFSIVVWYRVPFTEA